MTQTPIEALDMLDTFVSPNEMNADDIKPSYRDLKETIRAALTRLSELEPIIQELVEARRKATGGEWTIAKRVGDEINPASIGTAIPVGREAITMMPRYADNWDNDSAFIAIAANRIAKIGGV